MKLGLLFLLAALVAVVVSACTVVGGQTPSAVSSPAVSGAAAASPSSVASIAPSPSITAKYVGQFSISPGHAPAGSTITGTGSGFNPNTDLDLVWQGFTGAWKTGNGNYDGRDFQPVLQPLTKAKTDAAGNFQSSFTVPSGFGFEHDVLVQNGTVIQNKSNFNVDMQVAFSPSSGPGGTPISIDAKGIGWKSLENSWMVLYDNKFSGWISSVSTGGTAHAVIPAAGTPGKHIIQIIHGSATFPYMNMQQSPQPNRPSWTYEFNVTDGQDVQPASAATQSLPIVKTSGKPNASGPALWTDVSAGLVGTPLTIQGSALPAGQQVDLRWFRVVGSRVSGNGWDETSVSLGTVTVGADGNLTFALNALDDLGGPHRIEAQVGGAKIAETIFTISPSAFALSPASGPPDTTITVHLKGVGWTETANIYNLVYDNAYIGYACGFNSQGDVTVYLKATGEPGWHYIDLYPGIYKGNEMAQTDNFRIPQLTAAEDHPGENLPIFHFAFQVTQ